MVTKASGATVSTGPPGKAGVPFFAASQSAIQIRTGVRRHWLRMSAAERGCGGLISGWLRQRDLAVDEFQKIADLAMGLDRMSQRLLGHYLVLILPPHFLPLNESG